MNPLLSINIPTYNRARYLAALLDSLSDLSPELAPRVEVNILDNASPDDTFQTVHATARPFRVNYQRHERNLGGLQNIHLAHRAGTARYVWVLGDDDYLRPRQLARILKTLESEPAILLLSYDRATPEGTVVGKVLMGSSDMDFDRRSPEFRLSQVDSLIGFLSANIIERTWIDRCDAVAYEALDNLGELAHAAIFYTAIAAGTRISYLAGEPLVQTVDNGYLRHDVWLHVCVRYCAQLPEQLIGLGFEAAPVRTFFKRRLWRECARRVLSEKYRGHASKAVLADPTVRGRLGWGRFSLAAVDMIPASAVRFGHDLLRPRRN